ncbi:MAG: hypothetical protein IJE19_04615 [Clostridia bacterium]|nr:hypothetical protein [Clostridia bacterium]MBQ4626075.1 hypothetical protein [Clostridia bacterium]
MKKIALPLLIFIVLAVSGTVFGVFHSLYYESPPVCRPMVYYDGKLFWDEGLVETQPDTMEYIGTVNSRVPESEKPTKDFECNCKVFMNAKLYRDNDGNYYLYTNTERVLLLAY